MEFHITKTATLPILKLELIRDGRNDYQKFHEKIQNADIYFTMTDVITGVKRIARKLANIQLVLPQSDCVGEEFYIIYQFTKKETSLAGRYVGQFEIEFLDGTGVLIAPIREELYINVIEGSIKK
jgi:hypothetical protein